MSVQPFAAASASVEPPAPRPRPVERERQAFTVPDRAPAADAAREPDASASPAKDDRTSAPAKDDKVQAGKDPAAKNAAAKDGAPAAPAGKDAAVPATTDDTAAQPAAVDGGTKPVPAASTPAQPIDIGTLVAIAIAAAPTGPAKDVPGAKSEDGASDETKSKTESDDTAAPSPNAGIDLLAVIAPPDPSAQAEAQAQAQAPVAPPPTLAGDAKAVPGQPAVADVAFNAVGSVASPLLPVKAAIGKPATATVDSGAAKDTSASTEAGDDKVIAGLAGELGGSTAVKDAVPDPTGAPAAGGREAKDFKPIEALQLGQPAIDLSVLAQHRAGKHEAGATLTAAADQSAVQQGATSQGQAAASGQPTPLHVVPVEIGMKALAGMKQFEIRLDPAELGRVDVKLDISDKGEVSARLVVDRVETLHLLQRDARTLERAFEQAGLKSSDAGVEISLRDNSDQSAFRQQRQQDEAPRRSRTATGGDDGGDDIAISARSTAVSRVRLGGVDLSV